MTDSKKTRTPVGTLTPAGAGSMSHLMGMGMGMGPAPVQDSPNLYRSPTHVVYGNPLIDRHEWRHTVLLVEFLMKSGWADPNSKHTRIVIKEPPNNDSAETKQELEELRIKRDHEGRRQRADEVVSEISEYMGLFENLCFFDALSHPKTTLLLQTMDLLSWTLVSYFKEYFARPRPTELDPSIRPIIRVPGFAAYPSGHSTQVNLTNNALQHLIPGHLLDADSPSLPSTTLRAELDRITARIAENREWAGVHYRSDTTSGKDLADQIWALTTTLPGFAETIGSAEKEWDIPPGRLDLRYRMLNH